MKWYQIDSIVSSIIFGLCFGSYLCLSIRKNFHVFKPKAFIPAIIATICVLNFFSFISHKYDFRGKWEAYQFRKTMIDVEAFQKPIEPFHSPKIESSPSSPAFSIEESEAEADAL